MPSILCSFWQAIYYNATVGFKTIIVFSDFFHSIILKLYILCSVLLSLFFCISFFFFNSSSSSQIPSSSSLNLLMTFSKEFLISNFFYFNLIPFYIFYSYLKKFLSTHACYFWDLTHGREWWKRKGSLTLGTPLTSWEINQEG